MARCGFAITLTTATDVAAFLTGVLFSGFPVLRDWCGTMCFGLLGMYFLIITCGPAILSLDLQVRTHVDGIATGFL